MDQHEFQQIERYMLEQMRDSAHDKYHIYRVLYAALEIAETETADTDILVAACMLHDIGRAEQAADLRICHAEVGADKACAFLTAHGWDGARASHVRDCVRTHRYRRDNPPVSIEAKILFDSDKLDAAGALGIARTLVYEGQIAEPLYILDEHDRLVETASDAEVSSFPQEYHYKLKNLYDNFHTARARQIAAAYQQAVEDFYSAIQRQIAERHTGGPERLARVLSRAESRKENKA